MRRAISASRMQRPGPSGYYGWEKLENGLSLPSLWYFSAGSVATPGDALWNKHFAYIAGGVSGSALRITAPAASSPGTLSDGTVVGSSSLSGQLVALESNVSLAQIPNIHAGWASGDPQSNNAVGKHEECWDRFRMKFPAGYRPTLGTQNSTWELHFDRGSQAAFGQAVSPLIIVEGVGGTSTTVGGVIYDTAPSNVNQVLFQYGGGGPGEDGIGQRDQIISGAAFQFDHWYDFVVHHIFDVDPAVGQVEVWVDGVQKISTHQATSYLRPNGSWGYQEDRGIYNYRHWANWSSSIDYDEIIWGPTRASIGF